MNYFSIKSIMKNISKLLFSNDSSVEVSNNHDYTKNMIKNYHKKLSKLETYLEEYNQNYIKYSVDLEEVTKSI